MPSLLVGGISLLGELTGIGRCTFEIARRLVGSQEMRLSFYYGYISSRLRTSEEKEGLSLALSLAKGRIAPLSKVKKALRRFLETTARLHPGRFDVYWEPNLAPLPVLCAKSRMVAATIPDFSWLHHPEWHPAERVDYFKRTFRKSIDRADHVITYSRFIRDEAADLLGMDPAIIHVIPNGVDTALFRPYPREQAEQYRKEKGLPPRFILFTGTLEPRKNIVRGIEAFLRLPETTRAGCSLVLAGARGWENAEIERLLKTAGSAVRYLGYVTNKDLAYLYNLAEVFVFPSLYEGFGLPPLEAMACGTPVVVSNAASLPEVCGDAARYCDPTNPDSIADALQELFENQPLREQLIASGLRRSASFTWDACASSHLKLFTTLAKG